uniref:EF-hand domain-containing protein n=1 Tax=Chromera velia CCMP2878 TaxID=1169474 RepID=A0A0G4F0S5_9ALVE|eukprot:Cvel_14626.t1-p1 / transcript=Cvel_14626.t1 / gene=Cvel_14626 / organism=Chromera_velia_CCMP2878 / gene_product=hypothetical protein / transcript_product=hypothetical protein / location=Cvel_scaffold1046:45424-51456(+) / protein_length=741 / sequence_SO=supercontig / SO=protein_coding / is_pseudo=false
MWGWLAQTSGDVGVHFTEFLSGCLDFLNRLFIDPMVLPNDGFGLGQLCFLLLVYGYIAFLAAKVMTIGAELMMMVPAWKRWVPPVVLPILNAFPEAVLLFITGFVDHPRSAVAIGLGTLTGTTVLAIIAPTVIVILAGRVSVLQVPKGHGDPGGKEELGQSAKDRVKTSPRDEKVMQEGGWVCNYDPDSHCDIIEEIKADHKEDSHKGSGGGHGHGGHDAHGHGHGHGQGHSCGSAHRKLLKIHDWSLTRSAVEPNEIVSHNAPLVLLSLLPYTFLLIPAFMEFYQAPDGAANVERALLWTALVLCYFCFAVYVVWARSQADNDPVTQARADEMRAQALEENRLTFRQVVEELLKEMEDKRKAFAKKKHPDERTGHEATALDDSIPEETLEGVMTILRPYFEELDANKSGSLSTAEVSVLLQRLGEDNSDKAVRAFMDHVDADRSGQVDFTEFCVGIIDFMGGKITTTGPTGQRTMTLEEENFNKWKSFRTHSEEHALAAAGISLDDEKDLNRALLKIKIKGCLYAIVGGILAFLMAEPMILVCYKGGIVLQTEGLHVSPFLLALVVVPLVNLVSEFFMAWDHATKQTVATATLVLGEMEGATIVHNTLCLGSLILAIVNFNVNRLGKVGPHGETFNEILMWTYKAETLTLIIFQSTVFMVFWFKKRWYLYDVIWLLLMLPFCLGLLYGLAWAFGRGEIGAKAMEHAMHHGGGDHGGGGIQHEGGHGDLQAAGHGGHGHFI